MMVDTHIVIVVWTVYIISTVQGIQVTEYTEENSDEDYNTTTLYPVDKIPFIKATTENTHVKIISEKGLNTDRTTWKINTTFAIPKDKEKTNISTNTNKLADDNDCKELSHVNEIKDNFFAFPKDKINVDINEEQVSKKKTENKKYKQDERDKTSKTDFKPSPHLNSYYEALDDSPLHIFTTPVPPLDTPTFFGSPRDEFKPNHNNHHEGYVAFPYKYETYTAIDSGWGGQGLQSKPTIEAPVRIPAGGLYNVPDVLREEPNNFHKDHDYPPDSIDNVKENSLKKRVNPWKSLLHLVTTLLPVGLIISALTPSVITIENLPSDSQHFKRVSRRLGESPAFPAVSEDCKRRLLCEIHSDRHYDRTRPRYRPKQCYKIRCEEPQAVSRLLHWLLTYHSSGDSRARGYT